MAPRTRTRRQMRVTSIPQVDVTANTTGFAALPYELYLEIMSYWPQLPVPTEEPTTYDTHHLRERRFTMHALSRTCSSLRRVFLAFLWERIEVYDGMVTRRGTLRAHVHNDGEGRVSPQIHRKYAEQLVRQLETVTIRDPSLAEHVRILNVVVTDFSANTVLQELARCIALLPNLHTVQLEFGFVGCRQGVGTPFEDYTYPQIRTVSLSSESSEFLASCPNVRRVTAYKGRFWSEKCELFYPGIIERLGIVYDHPDLSISDIAKFLPKLRDITVDIGVLRADISLKPLAALRHLRTIRFNLNRPTLVKRGRTRGGPNVKPPAPVSEKAIANLVRRGHEILRRIPDDGDFANAKRRVIIIRLDGEIQIFNA